MPSSSTPSALERWGQQLAFTAAARPGRTLALALAVVLAMAPGLLRLELRTDGHALVPPNDPAILIDRDIRATFGLRDPLLVVLSTDHPDGVYNPETLRRLEALTQALAGLPGVGADHVVSLATEKSPRFGPNRPGFLNLLDPPPTTPERLAEVRDEVEAIDVAHGTLISFDRRAVALMVGVPNPDSTQEATQEAAQARDRVALYHQVVTTVAPFGGGGHQIEVVGAPVAEALLGEHIVADLIVLIPLSLLVIAAVLWLTCGGPWAAAVGLAKIGAAQVFTLGLLGWCGEPVYLTTAVIPVILTTVGLADEIHLISRLRQRREGESWESAFRATFGELTRPVILTSLTTALGFASFLTSSIRPVWTFGVFTAAGVLFCLGWALTATPALLALAPRAIPPRPLASALGSSTRWRRLAAYPRPVLAALGLVTLGLVAGLPRLQVQDSWIHNFAPESPLRQASDHIDRAFSGTHVLLAAVTFDPPADQIPALPNAKARGPLLAGATMRALHDFEKALRALPEVGGAQGLASNVSTTAFLWADRIELAREIRDNPAWIYLHIRRLANVRGEVRRQELIDNDYRRAVVTLLLKGANYQETARLIGKLRDLEAQILAPVHGRVELGGDVAVSQAMIPAIVRSQVASLLLAVFASWLVVAWLFRSWRVGLLCLAPTAVAVAWTFGLMGWLGVPLGVATSMFCAVTLGIGIDFGIHYIERYRAAQAAGTAQPHLQALTESGPAITFDALAIVLGFGLLVVSQVPANRRLGLLVATALASACLLTLAGLGSWLGRGEGAGAE